MSSVDERAKQLMDQVMKTWEPPRLTGDERREDVAWLMNNRGRITDER